MDRVELVPMLGHESESVGHVMLERVPGLRVDVNAHDLESGAHAGTRPRWRGIQN